MDDLDNLLDEEKPVKQNIDDLIRNQFPDLMDQVHTSQSNIIRSFRPTVAFDMALLASLQENESLRVAFKEDKIVSSLPSINDDVFKLLNNEVTQRALAASTTGLTLPKGKNKAIINMYLSSGGYVNLSDKEFADGLTKNKTD